MRVFGFLCGMVFGVAATAAFAERDPNWGDLLADVIVIGEYHFNPTHHEVQARGVEKTAPAAVVFEMLTPQEAEKLNEIERTPDAMRKAVQDVGWGNIKDYAQILAKSPVIVGAALPRENVRAAVSEGAAKLFGAEAERYGLTAKLPDSQLNDRVQLQFEAHCKAMPIEMMGGMVEAQRLRDAGFARAVLEALETYGAPVIFITGNGHARKDWGVPAYIAHVSPSTQVISIGQGEEFVPPAGTFDTTLIGAPPGERVDHCKAFR